MTDECQLLHELRLNERLLQRAAAATGNELHVQQELRREFPDELVRAALSLAELRRKAAAKFSRADQMWFDRTGLEQATSEPVARHKAQRFKGIVWDLCCGIGGDAIALAERCDVAAVDMNAASCLRTEWNAEIYGVNARMTTRCQKVEDFTARDGLVHIDPDRRQKRVTRAVRLEDYAPSLEFLQNVTREFPGGAIKLSPAANFGGKFPGAEIELVSLHGECKEATVWFGELAGTEAWRATVLPANETLAGDPLASFAAVVKPQAFVYDPDPAVVRAGLVDVLAERLGLCRLDDKEEYLTGDACIDSPFVQTFELLAELPNKPGELRAHFKASDVGQLEIKCRHIPIVADAVRRKLTLPGDQPGVLIIARVAGRSRALVCRRVDKKG